VVSDAQRDLGGVASVRVLHSEGALVLGARLMAGQTSGRTAFNDVDTRRLDLGAVIGWQLTTSRLTAHLLGDVSARLELVHLRDRSTGTPAAAAPTAVDRSVGVGPGASIGVELPFSTRLALLVELSGSFVVFRERAASGTVHFVAPAVLALQSGLSLAF
jgi:hypothetical protein